MSSFTEWLKEVGAPKGGTGLPPHLGPQDMEMLRKSLRKRMAQNEVYFRIAFGISVLLAITTIGAIIFSPTKGFVPGAFGISTAAAVAAAMHAVREKHSFDVMLELATGLDEKAVRQVLQVLLAKYARGKAT